MIGAREGPRPTIAPRTGRFRFPARTREATAGTAAAIATTRGAATAAGARADGTMTSATTEGIRKRARRKWKVKHVERRTMWIRGTKWTVTRAKMTVVEIGGRRRHRVRSGTYLLPGRRSRRRRLLPGARPGSEPAGRRSSWRGRRRGQAVLEAPLLPVATSEGARPLGSSAKMMIFQLSIQVSNAFSIFGFQFIVTLYALCFSNLGFTYGFGWSPE